MNIRTPPPRGDAPRSRRTYDAEGTRLKILDAAHAIFAEKGFDGANVNEIVLRARTTKPMVYYHFGDKGRLFAAVLERIYAEMRRIEGSLALDGTDPEQDLRRLVEVTFDYHADHPDWVRLIAIANIHEGRHIAGSASAAEQNTPIVAILRALLARGEAQGLFRAGVDPLHLHLLVNAMCFYRISNRHTWTVIFGRDLAAGEGAAEQRTMLCEAVLSFLALDRPGAPGAG